MNAHKWADLKELSDDELIAEHDAVAENTAVGTQHYLAMNCASTEDPGLCGSSQEPSPPPSRGYWRV